jgi:NAD(P)H-hydrate epimerase
VTPPCSAAAGFRPEGSAAALVSAHKAQALDAEASACWGLFPLALVEAAGRACAGVFAAAYPEFFQHEGERGKSSPAALCLPKITVLAGSGNNGADALVMLRALILRGFARPAQSAVIVTRLPPEEEQTPLSLAFKSIKALGVPVFVWGEAGAAKALAACCTCGLRALIIDGLAGTGLKESLRGAALEMAGTLRGLRAESAAGQALPGTPDFQPLPFVVSVDVPSGNFDGWKQGMPIVEADATLAVEPRKLCLYKPAARPFGGRLLSVDGIFPPELIESFREAELLNWERAASRIPALRADVHKYGRGLVEIRAGSPGAAGAARLAARGAQAAGAGLVRLIADPSLYPILAAGAGGIMVVPDSPEVLPSAGSAPSQAKRFMPDAALLGPGWGRGPDRARILENYLSLEKEGLPLILDADAVFLARDHIFHGKTLITPHTGEFSAYTGIPAADLLADPAPVLTRVARERNLTVLLKAHVTYIVSPDGRLGVLDGMNPALAAGGSGDLLAGFCAAIIARRAAEARNFRGETAPCGSSEEPAGAASGVFDLYNCAAAAAALLLEAGKRFRRRFIDPLEAAAAAAALAGEAWLGADAPGEGTP